MRGHSGSGLIEPRWPAALAIVAVLALLTLLPGRECLVPAWFAYALGLAILPPISAIGVSEGRFALRRIERLGFCTATASSPTGALPLRGGAMLLMMLESSISLVTIAVVAARSITILGA